MKISRLNERITFLENTVTCDRYRNRTHSWIERFSVFASVSTYTANESEEKITTEERAVTFETRWCPQIADVTSTQYRISFRGDLYNIESVDMMNYQKKTVKFICRREKRKTP